MRGLFKYTFLRGLFGYFLFGFGMAMVINIIQNGSGDVHRILAIFIFMVGLFWIIHNAEEEISDRNIEIMKIFDDKEDKMKAVYDDKEGKMREIVKKEIIREIADAKEEIMEKLEKMRE